MQEMQIYGTNAENLKTKYIIMKKRLLVVKLGGGAVNNAEALKKFESVVSGIMPSSQDGQYTLVLFVVSAFGGVTQMLQEICEQLYENNFSDEIQEVHAKLWNLRQYLTDLLFDAELSTAGFSKAVAEFEFFDEVIKSNARNQFFLMDPYSEAAVLGWGEQFASSVVRNILMEKFGSVFAIPAEDIIKTSIDTPLSADVLSDKTQESFNESFNQVIDCVDQIKPLQVAVTEGFIASSYHRGLATLLGMEGSDYSAAIFANAAKQSELFDDVELLFIKSTPGIVLEWHHEDEHEKSVEPNMTWTQLQVMVDRGSKIFHPKVAGLLKGSDIPTRVTNMDYFLRSYSDGKGCTNITG